MFKKLNSNREFLAIYGHIAKKNISKTYIVFKKSHNRLINVKSRQGEITKKMISVPNTCYLISSKFRVNNFFDLYFMEFDDFNDDINHINLYRSKIFCGQHYCLGEGWFPKINNTDYVKYVKEIIGRFWQTNFYCNDVISSTNYEEVNYDISIKAFCEMNGL